MRQFDDFLAQESAEGEFSSSGEFTVKLEHALKKLAEMALEQKLEWVLKVVQAAVVLGTQDLDFRIGRKGIQVDLSGEAVSLRPLEEGLLNPGIQPEPFWKELFVGLRTLLPLANFRVISGSGEWLEWRDGALHPGDGEELLDAAPNTALTLVVIPHKRLKSREVADCIQLLQSRALYAPLRLRLDGREIHPEEVHTPPMPEFGAGVPRWTAPLIYVHGDGPLSELTLMHFKRALSGKYTDSLRSLDTFLRFDRGRSKRPGSRFLYLKIEYEDTIHGKTTKYRDLKPCTFRLCFTRLGVVCLSRECSSLVGGVLCLPRDEARSDLAGLSIDPEPKNRSARSEVAPVLTILSQSILAHQSSFHYYGSDKGRLRAAFAMSGSAGFMFSLMVASNPLVCLTLAGMAGCAGAATMLNFGRDDYNAHLVPMSLAVQKLDDKLAEM